MNKYLGEECETGYCVEDTGRPGLDSLREVRDICESIVEQCVAGDIPYAKAMQRLNFLETTVIPRDTKLIGKKRQAIRIVQEYKEKLREECG